MRKVPTSVWVEVAVVLIATAIALPIALYKPDNPPSDGMARLVNGVGVLFQLVGLVVMAFEVLRGPLAAAQMADYREQLDEASRKFWDEIMRLDPKERVSAIQAHMVSRINLNRVYFAVGQFQVTVRVMFLLGLCMSAFGYTLQLAVL